MLQVRITDADGSNSIILNEASERKVWRAINSSNEGGSFKVPKNSAKADVLNPESGGDTKFWEIWDTATNVRKNFGPITQITEEETDWVVEGRGRSALLEDFYSSRDVFYAKIDPLLDSLRFEYVSLLPKASTLVPTTHTSAAQTTVFDSITIDEKYHGLSEGTKDNVIDAVTGPRPEPGLTTYRTSPSFWSGMSRNDALIVDLGEEFPLTKIQLAFPNWTSKLRWTSAGRDYSLAVATSSGNVITEYKGRQFGPFTELYSQGPDSHITGNTNFILGSDYEGTYDPVVYGNTIDVALDEPGPVSVRYIRVNIDKVHMWAGTFRDDNSAVDAWNYHCNPDYQLGDDPGFTRPASSRTLTEPISERDLKPENDCHASIIEVTAAREIFKNDLITPLARQRIDNNNMQITYYHVPDSSEITTTSNGYRHFEPGGFFRRFHVSWSGANTTYTKFFDNDCTNCYPDGFNFGVLDNNNTLVYSSDSSSGVSASITGHMYTRTLMMKGASNATLTYVDTWPATTDSLSYGASYSWTTVSNDYATIHFRGQSFKWYATIPANQSAATVDIDIRHKNGAGAWGSWTSLESSYQLPNNISAYPVYEITYESGTLVADTIYEIRITNLGGFCSIDSIEGFWSASLTEYNEESQRIFVSRPENMTQIYDSRFSNGSMFKWNKASFVSIAFEGDRLILVSAKGRNHGKVTLLIQDWGSQPSEYDAGTSNHVFIPGGDITDGSLEIDLATSKRGNEIAQYILFDSNDWFPAGLPWSRYSASLHLLQEDISTYSAYSHDSDNFVRRCKDCTSPTGTAVTTNKYVYFDGAYCHEKIGISVKFEDQNYLEQLSSITEALQTEWGVTEQGIRVEPRIGQDTEIILREGQNTVVKYQIVHDASKMASMLLSSGADIDGLPLSSLTEDRANRRRIGRSVTRKEDFRNISSYTQLIGLSRTELKKRRYSEKRMTVTYSGGDFTLTEGDTFILYTKKLGRLRVRIDLLTESESTSGRAWDMEVSKWPALQE